MPFIVRVLKIIWYTVENITGYILNLLLNYVRPIIESDCTYSKKGVTLHVDALTNSDTLTDREI